MVGGREGGREEGGLGLYSRLSQHVSGRHQVPPPTLLQFPSFQQNVVSVSLVAPPYPPRQEEKYQLYRAGHELSHFCQLGQPRPPGWEIGQRGRGSDAGSTQCLSLALARQERQEATTTSSFPPASVGVCVGLRPSSHSHSYVLAALGSCLSGWRRERA